MSSAESNSNEPQPAPGPPKGSIAAVVVSLALLAALAWAIRPRRTNFKPAPLDPQPPGCLMLPHSFVPTNLTEIPDPSLDALPPAARNRALLRMNMQPCPCGCNLSVASCRVSNPNCEASADLAKQIIAEEASRKPAPPAKKPAKLETKGQ